MEIVQNLLERVNFPLWINADIIQGPSFLGLPKLGMVDGNQFLNLTKQYVPNATLSPGKDINKLYIKQLLNQSRFHCKINQFFLENTGRCYTRIQKQRRFVKHLYISISGS